MDDAQERPQPRALPRGELAAVPVPAVDPGVQRVRVAAASALAVWWTREYDAVCEAFAG